MAKLIIIILSLIISGCANTLEFTKNIKNEDHLFDLSEFNNFTYQGTLDDFTKIIGKNKSGYIEPDLSNNRNEFIKKFPIMPALDLDYQILDGYTYNNKVGQVLRLSADLDRRTSGVLIGKNGSLISVSGMMKIENNPMIVGAASTGASQAIASGVSSNSLINPTMSSGANIAMGLGAGLIAGIIENVRIKIAIEGIISKKDYGFRMEEATGSGYAPSAQKINSLGFNSNKSTIKIAPGLVKAIYMVNGERNIQYKNQVFFLSVIGAFRGAYYKKLFPETNGWEFTITNINMIEVNMELEAEKRFFEIKGEVNAGKINL